MWNTSAIEWWRWRIWWWLLWFIRVVRIERRKIERYRENFKFEYRLLKIFYRNFEIMICFLEWQILRIRRSRISRDQPKVVDRVSALLGTEMNLKHSR